MISNVFYVLNELIVIIQELVSFKSKFRKNKTCKSGKENEKIIEESIEQCRICYLDDLKLNLISYHHACAMVQ